MQRDLDWDGAYNARDLSDVSTSDGRSLRRGAVVRSATPSLLTESGWAAAWEHGIRTIIDFTERDEAREDLAPRPAGITTLRRPLDPVDDVEFWQEWSDGRHGTPLYFRPYLDRFPDRIAAVLRTIAHAEPGGVLLHCSAGRDRTGLVCLVLLALVEIPADDIIADYLRSHEQLRPLFARLGMDDQEPFIEAWLTESGTTAHDCLRETLDAIDLPERMVDAGLSEQDLSLLRQRLLHAEDHAGR